MSKNDLLSFFENAFTDTGDIFEDMCPYRVCPLGAHSDHQFGLVSGYAIDKGVHIVFSPRKDSIIEVASMNFDGIKTFDIHNVPKKIGDWADYLRGATRSILNNHYIDRGMSAAIKGDLPIGGLSSSAAVIIAFLAALCRINNIKMSECEMVNTALWTENVYVGINCGKLDQSCEIYSKKDHLLFLDTKDDSYELIKKPDNMQPFKTGVFFSGIPRTLVGSAFNSRVDELRAAGYALKAFSGMPYDTLENNHMREIPYEVYLKYKDRLPLSWQKRCEHFYTEFNRVEKGAIAWRSGDITEFGRLSTMSGHSSIYNYETGSDELKFLYETIISTEGVYGGRFSGAGFKGCCIALVNPDFCDKIQEVVTEKYTERFPHLKKNFSVHFCDSADGCKLV